MCWDQYLSRVYIQFFSSLFFAFCFPPPRLPGAPDTLTVTTSVQGMWRPGMFESPIVYVNRSTSEPEDLYYARAAAKAALSNHPQVRHNLPCLWASLCRCAFLYLTSVYFLSDMYVCRFSSNQAQTALRGLTSPLVLAKKIVPVIAGPRLAPLTKAGLAKLVPKSTTPPPL
jgi:hypothetical protein